MSHPLRRLDRFHVATLGILLVAFALRVFGQNWDAGMYLHPDERFIAIVASERVTFPSLDQLGSILDPARSPLNPRRDGPDGKPLSFAYGTLPLFVQGVASWIVGGVTGGAYGSYADLYRVGRSLSALADLATLVFVMLIARRLFGRPAALIAGALYAFAVLPIQLSHFFTVDVWLTSFVTATLYFALRYMDRPTVTRALAVGVPVGCAFATKASVPSLLAPLALTFGWSVWQASDRRLALARAAVAGLAAVAVFALFEPYALLRPAPFINDIGAQARIVRGQWDVPFTRQFVGLTPGVYELRNLFAYGLGPGLLLSGIAGCAAAGREVWRLRGAQLALPLVWVVAYVPTLLITEARFMRYSLPLVPVLAMFAGGWLASWRPRYLPRLQPAVVAAAIGVTALWAVAFSNVYAQENPRIAASRWMNANIPAGSAVTVEGWDDALPLPYPGSPPLALRQISFDIYGDQPPEQKAAAIADVLRQADYVVLSSDRVRNSVDNLPWRYAVQNEYYRRLLDGQLGFQLVYEAQTLPGLLGVRVDDSGSDESFTVYDHPRVRIFKKVDALTSAQVRERLLWGISQPWSPTREAPRKQLVLGKPVAAIASTRDASWNTLAVNRAWLAIGAWLAMVELIGLAALPLAARLLRRTPDGGALSARLLGLLVIGWLGWVAASMRVWGSTAWHIAFALAVLTVVSWLPVLRRCRAGLPSGLPAPRRYLGWSTVWFGGFAALLFLRALYPDFWQTYFGGEKPFELAYLRAISQSVWYPPYDPWYADGTINYYYYGWHLLATLIKLSGVGVSLGFQLGAATFGALFGAQVVSLGGLLARRGRARLTTGVVAGGGLLTLVAVEVIGNLDGLRQFVQLDGRLSQSFDFWRSRSVIDFTINEFPYFSELWADVHPHVMNFPIVALLLTLLTHLALNARRSVPAHARDERHRFDLVAPAAAVALTLGTVGVTNSWDAPLAIGLVVVGFAYAGLTQSPRRGLLGLATGIGVTGASFVLFLPFYRGFYSVVQGVGLTTRGSDLGQFLTMWGIFLGLATLALGARAFAGGPRAFDRRDAALLALLMFVIGGGALGAGMLLGRIGSAADSVTALTFAIVIVAIAAGTFTPTRLRPLLLEPVLAVLVLGGLLSAYRPAATLALAVAGAALLAALHAWRRPSQALPWAFVALGSVLIAATELVYVTDDLTGSNYERMNTVFKFYLQAWLLFAIGTATLLFGLLRTARARLNWPEGPTPAGIIAGRPAPHDAIHPRPVLGRRRLSATLASGAGLALLAAGLIYPLAGTPVRLAQDMPSSPSGLSLDGYAWMRGGAIQTWNGATIQFSGDLEAIEWLNANVRGTPTILEAAIGPYRGNGSRISSATGLPAVLGWDRHQRQQRYPDGIDQRQADARAIYNDVNLSRKLEMLRRYNVRYVVVGDVERYWSVQDDPRPYASAEGLQAFEQLVGAGLTVAFRSGNTIVYQVDGFPSLAPLPGALRRR